jgi:hypothetical protein
MVFMKMLTTIVSLVLITVQPVTQTVKDVALVLVLLESILHLVFAWMVTMKMPLTLVKLVVVLVQLVQVLLVNVSSVLLTENKNQKIIVHV